MKKLLLVCTATLMSSLAMAQSSNAAVTKKAGTESAKVATAAALNTSSTTAGSGALMTHLKEKLRIRYFSETLGPSIHKLDDHQSNPNGTLSTDPVNVFNIVSFNYNFGQKMNFIFNPRFTAQLGDRNTMGKNEDRQAIQLDDFMTGFAGVIYTNGKFEYFARPSVRLTTSKFSRDQHTNVQYDYFHDLGYQISTKWRFDLWNSYRFYDNYNAKSQERYRIYFGPYLDYTINDKWHINAFYEYEVQHRNAKSGQPGKRAWNYNKKNYSDLYVGVAYNVSQNLSITPFVKFLDEANVASKNTILALWVSATLF